MSSAMLLRERYEHGRDIVNFIVYRRTTGDGIDEVLQHKILGMTESAHITLHPDGSVNFHADITRLHLEKAVMSVLAGYTPAPSDALRSFLIRIRGKLAP